MNIIKMELETYNNNETDRYFKKLRIRGTHTTGAVIMPVSNVSSISVHQTGSANIYLTNYPIAAVENNTAKWDLYDGVSPINNAVTAIYCDNASGNSNVMITAVRGQ